MTSLENNHVLFSLNSAWSLDVCSLLCGSCAVPGVKMESVYIYSPFVSARRSGLVECLSYWHTCCVSNGSTETQKRWISGPVWHVCMSSDAYSATCWRCTVHDSLRFNELMFRLDFTVNKQTVVHSNKTIHLHLYIFFLPLDKWFVLLMWFLIMAPNGEFNPGFYNVRLS